MKPFTRFAASLLVPGCLVLSAADAQVYPTKPVRIVAALTTGGPGDSATRGAAQVLSQTLGQSFVVENRPGGDGLIAGEACVRAAPDGYTLCTFDSFQVSLNPVIRAKMPYDTSRDLRPVIHLGFLPASILVNASVPANSLRELFDLARAKPGSITWGSFGLASSPHLYIEWLKNTKGVNFLNVPYKGAVQAWQALIAGEVQVAIFASIPAVPMVKAAKVKALAISTDVRSPRLPELPTIKESGMELSVVTWFGVMAPAGTPKDIVLRLNSEVAKGLVNDASTRQKYLTAAGIDVLPPAGASPEVFAEFLKREHDMYSSAVKAARVTIE